MPSPADVETLRLYLILPLYHEFVNSKNYEHLHTTFSNAVLRLKDIPKKIIAIWWAQTPVDWFENLVSNYKNVVAHIISFKIAANSSGTFEKKVLISFKNYIFSFTSRHTHIFFYFFVFSACYIQFQSMCRSKSSSRSTSN